MTTGKNWLQEAPGDKKSEYGNNMAQGCNRGKSK